MSYESAYNECPSCHGRKARPARFCRNCTPLMRAEYHYAWKGEAANATTKRNRAQRRHALTKCERCGNPAQDRHHRNGDLNDCTPANIAMLCRRCHMEVDGRLEALAERNRQGSKPPRPCRICDRETAASGLRHGRCGRCRIYFKRHRTERPVKAAA